MPELSHVGALSSTAKWTATAKPAWDKWVKDMEAKGYPGKAMLDDALRLVKQYSTKYQD